MVMEWVRCAAVLLSEIKKKYMAIVKRAARGTILKNSQAC